MPKSKGKRRKPKARSAPRLARRGAAVGVGVHPKLGRAGTHPVVRLGESELGYCMDPARLDDCLRPCVSTVLQVPPEQLPDWRLDKRVRAGEDPEKISEESWARLEHWLDGRGLELVFHEPVPIDRERWIGVCWGARVHPYHAAAFGCGLRDSPFRDHSLVMCHGDIIFDPAISVPNPANTRLRAWTPDQVVYGITIDAKE